MTRGSRWLALRLAAITSLGCGSKSPADQFRATLSATSCLATDAGEAPAYYCAPCETDSSCGGTDDDAGLSSNGNYCVCADSNCSTGYCATVCGSQADCPMTATCQPLEQPGGPDYGSACVPTDEVCPEPTFDAGSVPSGVLASVQLTGCPLVGYNASVTIDGQSFQLSLDTGSTDTAVALTNCTSCDVSPAYDPPGGSCSGSTSSLYGFSGQNQTGWTAEICSASVQVGGELPAVDINFGGMTSQQGFFIDENCQLSTAPSTSQGVLGMGPLDLDTLDGGPALGDKPSLNDGYFSELVAQGVTDVVGLLLCTTGGGMMWLGGYDTRYASGAPQFTPLTSSGYWSVSLTSIGLGSQDLGGADANAVIDTGTSSFLMPQSALDSLVSILGSDASTAPIFGARTLGSSFFESSQGVGCIAPLGGQSQAEVDAALPWLTLTFPSACGGSFTLSLPPTRSYLVPIVSSNGQTQYCAGVGVGASSASQGPTTILGATVLRGMITILDEGNGQVGFVPQTFCD